MNSPAIPRFVPLLIIAVLAAAPVSAQDPQAEFEVTFTVIDAGTGAPFPARIHLRDATGEAVNPGGVPFHKTHFTIPGVGALKLKASSYTYEIEHGP